MGGKHLKTRLKEKMEELGLNNVEAARVMSVHPTTVAKMRSGGVPIMPGTKTMRAYKFFMTLDKEKATAVLMSYKYESEPEKREVKREPLPLFASVERAARGDSTAATFALADAINRLSLVLEDRLVPNTVTITSVLKGDGEHDSRPGFERAEAEVEEMAGGNPS